MTDRKKNVPIPVLSRWGILLIILAFVPLALIAWEIFEQTAFSHLPSSLLRRWNLWRSVIGASLITLVAVKIITVNWERAYEEISKKDRFLASIMSNTADAMGILDAKCKILFWNRAMENMLGYSQEEVIARNFDFLAPREPGYGEHFENFMEAIRDKRAVRDHEVEVVPKSGKRMLLNLAATQILDPEGQFLGITVMLKDITRDKALQENMEQSDRVSALAQLAASIAHEIGTPLNVISGNAEYLLGGKETGSTPGRELKIVIEETERISKLIKRLMHLTQTQPLDLKETQINVIIEKVLDITAHEIEKARVNLECHLEQNLPNVLGDTDQLLQVFLNLVINAIQSMPTGGRLLVGTSLWYVESTSNPVVQIRVTDTGAGISKEILPKIFNPFFSTKKEGGCSGLGLSVSYRIIEGHRGTIKFDSVVGKGTSVTVRLPCVVA